MKETKKRRPRKPCPPLTERRDRWHRLLDALDDVEQELFACKLLDRGPLMLAAEQISDVREALLEARPR